MTQRIFLIIISAIFLIGGIEIFGSFMSSHPYYSGMLSNGSHRRMIIRGILSSLIPIIYLRYSKKLSLKRTFLCIYFGLLVFSVANIVIKDTLFGASAFIMLLLNVSILVALSLFFITGIASFGSIIATKIRKREQNKRQDMLLSFGGGLGAFLLIIHFLVIAHALFPIITRLLFIGLGYCIYRQKNTLQQYKNILQGILTNIQNTIQEKNRRKLIPIILIVISCMYYFYGFSNSFIAYPTARDANHAYMYIPKVRAENHGALGVGQPGGAGNYIRYSYIAIWFSLIQPIKSRFRLSPDSIATSMNFLSGLFVLFFGLGLIKEMIEFVIEKVKKTLLSIPQIEKIGLYTGRFGLLAWLTSGMGAFLLFVDNKTDMGVLAITILALLSGILAIRYIHNHKDKKYTKEINKYLIASGIFFGFAILAKPTAFIDVVIFILFVVGLRYNIGLSIGISLIVLGILAKLQVVFSYVFLSTDMALPYIISGLVVIAIAMGYQLIKNKKILSVRRPKTRYLLIRVASIMALLAVTKLPYVIPTQFQTQTFSPSNVIKGLIMGYEQSSTEQSTESKKQLLASMDIALLAQQTQVDQTIATNAQVCSLESLGIVDSKQLYENTKKVPQSAGLNEDVGRYVGFGRKQFTNPKTRSTEQKSSYGFVRLGYPLLRLLFRQDNKCYSLSTTAKLFCENAQNIDTLNVTFIEQVYATLSPDHEIYPTIAKIVESDQWKNNKDNIDVGAFREELVAIRQYYQGHSILTQEQAIFIPYRYLVPFNVVFNRSLQNYSSYYTDIGFIWLLFFIIIDIAIIYALIRRQRDLLALSLSTAIGWIIWRFIAGGIVWYGIGLIIRTIVTAMVFVQHLALDTKDNKAKQRRYTLFVLAVIRGVIQIFLNFIRISSQGGSGPFIWYKSSVGREIVFTDTLQQQENIKIGYQRQDVFKLQFPQYQKFIDHTANKPDEHGISIEGTYLAYFLKAQKNVGHANIREMTSDGDTCKSYLRFRDKGRKYLVTDPNILSIVMGEGNESLLHRFFAKRNPTNGEIQEDGQMTMLVKMRYDGYISLFNSNNLGAKYAFTVSDEELQAAFGEMSYDDLVYTRAKMAVARFFPDAPELINFVGNKFGERILNGQAIQDIADILGRSIDSTAILNVALQITSTNTVTAEIQEAISKLSQDERFILAQYLTIYNTLRTDVNQYQQVINNLLQQSLASSSQIIILELKD